MQDDSNKNDFYKPEDDQHDLYSTTAQTPEEPADNPGYSLTWTASEFIQHEKTIVWYMGLAIVTALLAISAYLLLDRDIFSLVIIIILGFIFGVAGSRKPRVLNYTVDDHGIIIDQKDYDYDSFKSYSFDKENSVTSLLFVPNKRLDPSLTVYVPEDKSDEVIDLIGMYLPVQKHETGFFDKFLNKIKF